jgi:hypothetical protein
VMLDTEYLEGSSHFGATNVTHFMVSDWWM